MHDACQQFIARAVREHGLNDPRFRVLEIGSRDVNGSVRPLFDAVAAYTGIDVTAGPGVDVVCDGARYLPDAPFDVVVTTEALEHCPHWPDVLRNAWRMLAPGGWLLVTAAGPERAPHGCDGGSVGDEHYAGIAPDVLHAELRAFDWHIVERNAAAGDVYAIARVARAGGAA